MRMGKARLGIAGGIVGVAAVAVATAIAGSGHNVSGGLTGYQEVPAVSSTGTGTFKAALAPDGESLNYTLSYADLEGSISQAHIHFGQRDVNGGIAMFLCTNLGNGPPGTQPCPPPPATVTGTITAADVVGAVTAQGIAAEELGELLAAIRAGVAYANVHTTKHPGGEIRAQVRPGSGTN